MRVVKGFQLQACARLRTRSIRPTKAAPMNPKLTLKSLDATTHELEVRVSPGSSRSKVSGLHGGGIKVAVRAPPQKGRANEEVIEVLAEFFGVPERNVSVVSGHTSKTKRVRLIGLTAQQIEAALRSNPKSKI